MNIHQNDFGNKLSSSIPENVLLVQKNLFLLSDFQLNILERLMV